MNDDTGPAIDAVLSRLGHLNLSDRISSVNQEIEFYSNYNDIYTGMLRQKDRSGEVKVAFKRLRVHLMREPVFAKSFAKEMTIWAKLDHRNIVHLEGFIMEGGFPVLISFWAEKGSLRSLIKLRKEYDTMQMVDGVAEGIAYLHSLGIIHSDLKSENVLIDDSGRPMICDFGLSRMMTYSLTILASSSVRNLKGTIRYLAYELTVDKDSLRERAKSVRGSGAFSPGDENDIMVHTKATDMWAFGMLVLEIFTRKLPYSHLSSDLTVLRAIIDKVLPMKPRNLSPIKQELWLLCSRCWDFSPSERMTIEEAVGCIDVIRKHSTTESDILPQYNTSTAHQSTNSSPPSSTNITRNTLLPLPRPAFEGATPPAILTPSTSVPAPSVSDQLYISPQRVHSDLPRDNEEYSPREDEEECVMDDQSILHIGHEGPDDDDSIMEMMLSYQKVLVDMILESEKNGPTNSLATKTWSPTFSLRCPPRWSILKEFLDSERKYWAEISNLFRMLSRDPSEFLAPEGSATTTLSRHHSTSSTTLSYSSEGSTCVSRDFSVSTVEDVSSQNLQNMAAFSLSLMIELCEEQSLEKIGGIFLEKLPELRALYRTYITKETTARMLYKDIAMPLHTKDEYNARVRIIESSSAGRYPLIYQSCLPVLRMQQYATFLESIVKSTDTYHPDMEDTVMASQQLNIAIEGIKDRCYRLEVINETLAKGDGKSTWRAAKSVLPDIPPMKLLKSVSLNTDNARNRARDWYDNQSQRLKLYEQFIATLMQDMVAWIHTVKASYVHLRVWGYTLRAMDECGTSSRDWNELLGPINEGILPLCVTTTRSIKDRVLPILRKLLEMLGAPSKLVSHVLSLRAYYKPEWLLRPGTSRTSHRGRIVSEQLHQDLPVFFEHIEKCIFLCIKEFVAFQKHFWNETRCFWMKYRTHETLSRFSEPRLNMKNRREQSLDDAEGKLQMLRISRRNIHPKVSLVRSVDEAFAAHILDIRPSTSTLSGSG